MKLKLDNWVISNWVISNWVINNWVMKLLYLFLATDLSLMLINTICLYTDQTSNSALLLETDGGYAEVFQYIKEFWNVLLLVFLATKTRLLVYLSWSLLFLYLLIDDSVQIHERFGALVSKRFEGLSMLGLRANDFGEILISVAAGFLLLTLIAISYRFGDRLSRKVSKCLIIMLCMLAACGLVLDVLHVAVQVPVLTSFIGLLEDGGEMLVMSVITCFLFSLVEQVHTQTGKGRSSSTMRSDTMRSSTMRSEEI
ncbi:MAG: hypothetical protein HC780_24890 [Leptolyngbyaceae cyanobacterium CSU_1_3]|nr:hypothetical protein [Leptolyngbyaceae cyanobacterium CSU_1_3]